MRLELYTIDQNYIAYLFIFFQVIIGLLIKEVEPHDVFCENISKNVKKVLETDLRFSYYI